MIGIEYSFQKLKVWQEAKKLVVDVCNLLDSFPKFEKYGRRSLKEKIHFLEISYGSLMEAFNQLLIAIDLTYITEESVEAIKPSIDAVAKMINALCNTYSQKIEEQNSLKLLNS